MLIDVHCHHCSNINTLPFENSFTNQTIRCSNCQTPIYWYHCVECETGFYLAEKDASCPDCSQKKVAARQRGTEPESGSLVKYQCPNCSAPFSRLSFLGNKCFIICKNCEQGIEASGATMLFRSFLYMFSFIVLASIIDVGSEGMRYGLVLIFLIVLTVFMPWFFPARLYRPKA